METAFVGSKDAFVKYQRNLEKELDKFTDIGSVASVDDLESFINDGNMDDMQFDIVEGEEIK